MMALEHFRGVVAGHGQFFVHASQVGLHRRDIDSDFRLRFEHFFKGRLTPLGDGDQGRIFARDRRASTGERKQGNG